MGIYDRDYYWENRDIDGSRLHPKESRRHEFSPPNSPRSLHQEYSPERLLKFLTIISLFVVFSIAGYLYFLDRQEKLIAKQLQESVNKAALASKAQFDARAAAEASFRQRRQELLLQQSDQQKQLAMQLQKEIDLDRKREAAWNRFYQPTSQCLSDWNVECANTLIKARREFSVHYKD